MTLHERLVAFIGAELSDNVLSCPSSAVIRTESGSLYAVTNNGEGWFVRGENVENFSSKGLGTRNWPIQEPTPWPPEAGECMKLISKYVDEPVDHPDRMPGGGKITSRVVEVEFIIRLPSPESAES